MVEQAVVGATQNAEDRKRALENAGVATSSTHRAEYMAFLRAAKHPCHGILSCIFLINTKKYTM
jgi:hypothetical protein